MARSTVRSPFAHCLLIRLTSQVLSEMEEMYVLISLSLSLSLSLSRYEFLIEAMELL